MEQVTRSHCPTNRSRDETPDEARRIAANIAKPPERGNPL
jgi:hypothetical protein